MYSKTSRDLWNENRPAFPWTKNSGKFPCLLFAERANIPQMTGLFAGDHACLALILSERIGYAKRFYYSGVVARDITIRASGAGVTLKAWKISPISTDRLTTIGPLA
jgi:hypothetical protein